MNYESAGQVPTESGSSPAQPSECHRLLESARRFALSALDARAKDDAAVFLLHGGTSLEHLLKAFLALVHPALIRESRKDKHAFDLLLHVAGRADVAEPLELMRTVSLTGAIERSARLIPEVQKVEVDLKPIVDVRNGVAHVGEFHPKHVEVVLAPFLRTCALVLTTMGVDSAGFWGSYKGMVDTRLSESAKEAAVRAQDAVAAAKRVYEEKYESMDPQVREAVLATIEERYDPEKYEQQLEPCPACERKALVSGWTHVSWEPDFDYDRYSGDTWVAGVYPEVDFHAGELECAVCGLHLDGEDELGAAGVDTHWTLDEIDPEDFVPDDEYDDY